MPRRRSAIAPLARSAERLAALEEFERAKRDLFRRDGLGSRNMAVFRSVNERISDLAISRDDSPEQFQGFICECSQIGCTESVSIPLSVYAQLRADPRAFLVLPGHEDAEIEDVVIRLPEYVVVLDKSGVAAAIGQSTEAGRA